MDLLQLVKGFNEILWNNFLMYVLLGVGIFYTIYLGFPQVRHAKLAFKYAFSPAFAKPAEGEHTGKVNSFQALATAVAAQVGTGNVAGIATAVAAGGMGAVFWMWLSAFFGMGTIFSEAILAQKYRQERDGEIVGGPAYYIHKGLRSKKLAIFFSIAIILAIGCIGEMVQANSIAIAVTSAFEGIPSWLVGIFVALLVATAIMGGQRRITSIAELVVPFMALAYIIGSIVIVVMYADQLSYVMSTIFKDAFSLEAVAGGAAGTVMREAIRYGVARGLFSNEAGMGSTPHAHALAHVKDPSIQGFVAMAGVFITLLICTSTAMVILLTGTYNSGLASVAITQEAFRMTFGSFGLVFLAVSLLFFAFTTIIGWYIFGEMNVRYLFGSKGVYPFRGIVLCCIFLGTVCTADLVWQLADTFNGIMVIPNVIALIFLAPQVRKIYKRFLQRRKTEKL